ncbi:hypothetical protein BGZ83_010455 [Gryganskiella cystojenkinii]|nr:hypothetical protein BGZ83_010455 [Gryganskiella cystojenkinii]
MNSAPPPPYSINNHPQVLIAGAGIGGLFLAILLDRAGITYEIFERGSAIKAMGSIMGINANILPVFEQLGLYDELKSISLPSNGIEFLNAKLERIASIDISATHEHTGYPYHLFRRGALMDLLVSKVSMDKIHFNKRVVWAEHNSNNGVYIRCEDGTSYDGDILIGADGAYSAVRDALYRTVHCAGLLPVKDTKEMNKGYICLVGTTIQLDPERFPLLEPSQSNFFQILGGDSPYSISIFNVPDNRVCFLVVRQLASAAQCEEEKYNGIPWEPERALEMMEEIKDFKLPYGRTLGDLFFHTPNESISRVYLEDKLFKTWNHGRIALMGDAAHKLLPSAGQGAVCAMQDAVVLVNCLYDMPSWGPLDIAAALKDYRDQRYPQVKIQVENSNRNAIIFHGHTFKEKFVLDENQGHRQGCFLQTSIELPAVSG